MTDQEREALIHYLRMHGYFDAARFLEKSLGKMNPSKVWLATTQPAWSSQTKVVLSEAEAAVYVCTPGWSVAGPYVEEKESNAP